MSSMYPNPMSDGCGCGRKWFVGAAIKDNRGGSIGELTVVASAKRATRGDLKDEAKKLKEEVKMLRGVAKEQGGGGGEGKNSKDDKVEKRKIKNIKRRERDRKRRD